MPYAPLTVVTGPSRQEIPFGLFSVVSLAEAATERWENGVSWTALTCDPAAVVVGDCTTPEGFPKQFPDGTPIGEADAFTVYGSYKCNPIGGGGLSAGQEAAREHLEANEQYAVENRVWDQIAALSGAVALTGGNAVQALGEAEQWIADNYGSQGVIHANRYVATVLASRDLLIQAGGRLQTVLGTPVVAGGGYGTTGVAGAAPAAGSAYLAVTGAMFGYRSQIFEGSNRPGDLLDTGRNDLYGIAERNYLVGIDPCGAAFAPLTLE